MMSDDVFRFRGWLDNCQGTSLGSEGLVQTDATIFTELIDDSITSIPLWLASGMMPFVVMKTPEADEPVELSTRIAQISIIPNISGCTEIEFHIECFDSDVITLQNMYRDQTLPSRPMGYLNQAIEFHRVPQQESAKHE